MLCVLILYKSGVTYNLKSIPNDRCFKKLFMAIFIFAQSFLPEICCEEIAEEIFSYFVLEDSNPFFLSNNHHCNAKLVSLFNHHFIEICVRKINVYKNSRVSYIYRSRESMRLLSIGRCFVDTICSLTALFFTSCCSEDPFTMDYDLAIHTT